MTDRVDVADRAGSKTAGIRAGRSRGRRRSTTMRLGTLFIAIGLLVVLQIAGALDVGGAGTLPTTTEVVGALIGVLGEPGTYAAVGATFTSWFVGFAICIVLGVLVGLLVAMSSFADRSTRGLFDFMRSTPSVALIPMVTLILGVGLSLKVVIIVLTGVWVILVQTVAGLRSVDAIALESASSLRMTRSQRIRWVLLPTALPFMITGMRLVAVYAFLASIAVELLAAAPGLGREILFRQLGGAVSEMWAFVVLAAVLGVLVSVIFTRIEARLLRWHVSQRDK